MFKIWGSAVWGWKVGCSEYLNIFGKDDSRYFIFHRWICATVCDDSTQRLLDAMQCVALPCNGWLGNKVESDELPLPPKVVSLQCLCVILGFFLVWSHLLPNISQTKLESNNSRVMTLRLNLTLEKMINCVDCAGNYHDFVHPEIGIHPPN